MSCLPAPNPLSNVLASLTHKIQLESAVKLSIKRKRSAESSISPASQQGATLMTVDGIAEAIGTINRDARANDLSDVGEGLDQALANGIG